MNAVAARSLTAALGVVLLVLLVLLVGGCGGDASGGNASGAAKTNAGFTAPRGCPAHVRLIAAATRHVGVGADALAVAGTSVWVARPQASTITRVGSTGATTMRVGASPVSLATGFGKLWIAERDANRIATIDMRTLALRQGATLPLPVSVVAEPSGVWALSLDAGAVYPLDTVNGAAGEAIYAPVSDPSEMVASGEDLWILGAGDSGLSPINAKLGRIVRAGFGLPGRPLSGLSAAGSALWLGEPNRHALLRVDAPTGAVQELPAPDGIQPTATAVASCGVWVADASGELAFVDPATAAPLGPAIHVGRSIAALAPSGSGVWATDPLDGTLTRIEATASA